MKKILITGAAGFIGYHLCERLVKEEFIVVGLDNINDYYDVNLKYSRLQNLGIHKEDIVYNKVITSTKHSVKLKFLKLDLEDRENLPKLFEIEEFDIVCNLAAQAGVRHSLEKPFTYIESNILGFLNILEACRNFNVKKLVYASSSSVYGLNEKVPFSTDDNVDYPISLYAASKKSNELMAHTYSHLFTIETIGLRFFTVYGPWGRPDMAMFLFTDAILNNKPINVFNNGNLSRDFTYIDDIVDGIIATVEKGTLNNKKHNIYNIGNGKPIELLKFIEQIELCTGIKAEKLMLPMQAGDVESTWADTTMFNRDFNYIPNTEISVGVCKFIEWYREYYCK